MFNKKIFLFAAIALSMVPIANADLSLTVNGLDATVPLKVEGKENLMISVVGAGDVNEQSYSVICEDRGSVEPVSGPSVLEDDSETTYRFVFDDDWELGQVMLVADEGLVINGISVSAGTRIYKLLLCYSSQAQTTTAIGIDFEALSWVAPETKAKSEPQAEQQIFVSQDGGPERDYFAGAFGGRTSGLDSFPEPNFYPSLNGDDIVNFADFAVFADNWQKSGAGLDGDFDDSGAVDINDLEILAYFWLNGPHPVDVFGLFKAALLADDIDEAITYFSDSESEKYTIVLAELRPEFQEMANGMGELILISNDNNVVRYEMLHDEGGGVIASFPVYFSRDEHGEWKIYCF